MCKAVPDIEVNWRNALANPCGVGKENRGLGFLYPGS